MVQKIDSNPMSQPPGEGGRVLLHTCCAPCSSAIVECLLNQGITPTIYYCNPNIFPEEEYEKRKGECMRYAERLGVKFVEAEYDHIKWLEAVKGMGHEPERGNRCLKCFTYRLMDSASYASKHGYSLFATTLAASRWKSLVQINAAGMTAQDSFPNVTFWDRNWRKGGLQERRGEIIKEMNFYNQTYCGCEFSMNGNNSVTSRPVILITESDMDQNHLKPETLCVHAGWKPKNGETRQLPIYQSTTFTYESTEQMADLFDLKAEGYFYTRLQNPTNDYVAEKIAALEGGVAAMLTSSGQAASFYSVFNICEAGDHFVSSSTIYGGTFNLFAVTMKKLGIEVTFVDADASEQEISQAFRPNTKALFGETITNPAVKVLDIEKFARIAHSHGVPLIIDNTFPTPINCRPFELGADIVIHSTTKYMDGHATQVGGVIVDSGNFDWEKHHSKYPGLTEPDPSYHGLTFSQSFGKKAYITKATTQLMRDLGSIPSPQNAFLLNLGLETLALRMKRHCENALAVAEFLQSSPEVAWVNYSGLKSDPYYELARKQFKNGMSCGVIAFGLKGGRERAIRFMDHLKLVSIVTHVADTRSCVLHPASHTHRQLSDEQLLAAGVQPDLIRFSVGIEDIEDILADVQQALKF